MIILGKFEIVAEKLWNNYKTIPEKYWKNNEKFMQGNFWRNFRQKLKKLGKMEKFWLLF